MASKNHTMSLECIEFLMWKLISECQFEYTSNLQAKITFELNSTSMNSVLLKHFVCALFKWYLIALHFDRWHLNVAQCCLYLASFLYYWLEIVISHVYTPKIKLLSDSDYCCQAKERKSTEWKETERERETEQTLKSFSVYVAAHTRILSLFAVS